MRLIIDADRPEALWLALRIVQAVLRDSQELGLLVQREEACGFDRLSQFPDFGGLARLHFRTEPSKGARQCRS